jgi:GNAT superfamily N-acetyltransferase
METSELSSLPSTVNIRPATPDDAEAIFQLILALADYEELSHEVKGSPALLKKHLFGERPYAECIVADLDGKLVGQALFFHNFSTFLAQPGLYLEDLFVLPAYRRQGIGTALLRYVANIAVERGCHRLDWQVLAWNQSAIAFYQRIGAHVFSEWRTCRVAGDTLQQLADSSCSESS